MKKVVVYTSTICPYCIRAKNLLEKKGVNFQELNIDKNPDYIDEVLAKSNGQTTVPQIFIDGYHVGGYEDLLEMDRSKQLEQLL